MLGRFQFLTPYSGHGNRCSMVKEIEFNGIKYVLLGNGKYYLSTSKTNAGRMDAKSLHVAVYEFFSGKKVPKGFIVHHEDGNHFNNDFSNLKCISREQHRLIHFKEKSDRGKTPKQKRHLSKIRRLATAWHKSAEGRLWHKQNAIHVAEKRRNTFIEHNCIICNVKFLSNDNRTKFCSVRCQGRHRRKTRVEFSSNCIVCSKRFTALESIPRSKNRKTCSNQCSRLFGILNSNMISRKQKLRLTKGVTGSR